MLDKVSEHEKDIKIIRSLNIVNFIPQTLAHRLETDERLGKIDKDLVKLYA